MRLSSPLRDRRSALLLVGLAAGLVFANSLANGFAYDDVSIVADNTNIHSLASLPRALMVPYWPGDYGREMGLWRPTTTGILGLQYVIGGGSPVLFHAVNVLGHMIASVLVLLLLMELMSLPAALAAGLVFAVHPVHVEAVANIVGVAEVVSTVALLLACLIHVRSGSYSGWAAALAIGTLYAIGFGAKESAVTLPGIVFLLDAARRRIAFPDVAGYVRDRWRLYSVLIFVAGMLLWGRYSVLGTIASPAGPLGADILAEIPRIWTLGEVWTHYVRLWVLPLDLSSDYSPDVIPISLGWHAANTVGLVLALVILTVALIAWRRPAIGPEVETSKMAAFGVVWFVITISPISNTLFISGVLLAERTLYLPSVGLAAATGWLVVRLSRERPRGAWVVLVVVLMLSGIRCWTRSPTWVDNPTMLSKMIEDYPHSGRSQWILGDEFLGVGRVSDGLRSYRAAINILGTQYQLVTEISKKLLDLDRYRSAEGLLKYASNDRPELPLALGILALIRAEYGDAEGTEEYARRSIAVWDFDPTRRHLLAWALAAQGRWDEARAARARALEQGRVLFWQQYMYDAYMHRQEGDTTAALASVDSAWTRVGTDIGRAALDSVRVTEFGLAPLRGGIAEVSGEGNK